MKKQAALPGARARCGKPFRNMALLVVDMQDFREGVGAGHKFTCGGGTLEQGMEKFCSLIRAAMAAELPIIALRHNSWFRNSEGLGAQEIMQEIKELLDGYGQSREFVKMAMHPFDSGEFRRHLADLDVSTLIVGGYHAAHCVPRTVRAALDNGLQVITSDDIIFGNTEDGISADGAERVRLAREATEFYTEDLRITYLESVEMVIHLVNSQA